ncbi:Sulfotransferase family protein [Caulobacter sp. UNC279MFTsu5.1]|nr:Sulfotransferase family protein [Caulobacter sp. UNC279MFTsu5.1]
MFMREYNLPQWAANILTDSAKRDVLYPRSIVTPADLVDPKLVKFAFIRNPWARMASAYGNVGGSRHVADQYSFEALIESLPERHATPVADQENAHFKPASYFLPRDAAGQCRVDILGRVETCQRDWRHITDTVRILPFDLPHYNPADVPTDYRSVYTARTRNIVGDLFAEDIQLGNYDF